MQRLRHILPKTAAGARAWYERNHGRFFDWLTYAGLIFGLLALLALVFYAIRPIKTAEIKVPVATDLTSYYPGQNIKGIFFGDTYYTGQVRILREVFCENYKGVIKPPAESAAGNFFASQAKPRHLEGTSVSVGALPDDVPLGKNCVMQFTNVYDIQTPFGVRHIEYQYYTQNFGIVTAQRRCELDRQAGIDSGACARTSGEQTGQVSAAPTQQDATQPAPTSVGSASGGRPSSSTTNTTNNYSTTVNNPPAQSEPAQPVTPPAETCTINLLGIRAFCSR